MLIEVLRLHLATAPAADRGWLAALRDPVLAPALSLLHNQPDRRWTVAGLAAGAAVSRSLLDERFRQVLGRSPIRCLTEWRMHLAQELLATTTTGMARIARRVGYDSEEAFSRAFKRAFGSPRATGAPPTPGRVPRPPPDLAGAVPCRTPVPKASLVPRAMRVGGSCRVVGSIPRNGHQQQDRHHGHPLGVLGGDAGMCSCRPRWWRSGSCPARRRRRQHGRPGRVGADLAGFPSGDGWGCD